MIKNKRTRLKYEKIPFKRPLKTKWEGSKIGIKDQTNMELKEDLHGNSSL